MLVTCLNPSCKKTFLQKNRLQKFCTHRCRSIGMIDFSRAKEVDPISEINRLSYGCDASFFRLGIKLTQEIRYFPRESAKTPISALPALPRPGRYVVQLFDSSMNLISLEETVIAIDLHQISTFCRFTEGTRSRLIPGTET